MRTVLSYGEHVTREPKSIELGRSLENKPVKNIFPVCAYPEAVEFAEEQGLELPYLIENPSTSYPFADPESRVPERRAAAKVIEICREIDPDLIASFHTTRTRTTAAYLHSTASRRAIRMAAFMQMPHIIFADIPNVGSQFEDTITLDISEHDKRFMSITEWRRELEAVGELSHEDFDNLLPPETEPKVWIHAGTLMVQDLIDRLEGAPLSPNEIRDYIQRRPYMSGEPQPIYSNDPLLSLSEAEWLEAWRTGKGLLMTKRHLTAWSDHYMDETGGVAEWVVPASRHLVDYVTGRRTDRPAIEPYAPPNSWAKAGDTVPE